MSQSKAKLREQRKRRKANNKIEHYSHLLFEGIDGNLTHYPYGYCKYYKGWLTNNMSKRHKCEERKCHLFLLKTNIEESIIY